MHHMQSHSVYKIPQGKLLKISLDYDAQTNRITTIRITGDFFAYPEESIELLEKKLRNIPLEETSLHHQITSIISKHNIEFIGLNAEDLTKGIMMCKP
jgi:lipoate-protein ligase A